MQNVRNIVPHPDDIARAVELLPRVTDEQVIMTAARFLAWAATSTVADIDDDVRSIVADMATLSTHADMAAMEVGSVDPLRESHIWIDAYKEAREADPYSSSRVPDYYVSARSEITSKRSNSGRTKRTVVRNGRAWVVGSHMPTDADDDATRCADVVPFVARHMLGRVRRSRGGTFDGLDVLRATHDAYGADVPTMIGTDVHAWSEVLPELTSALVAASGWSPAMHTQGMVDVQGRVKLKHRGTTVPKVRVRPEEARPIGHRTLLRSDPRDDVPDWQTFTVQHVAAGHLNAGRVWIGHKHYPRAESYRDKRAAGTMRRASVTIGHVPADDAVTPGAHLVNVAGLLTAGTRATTHIGNDVVTVSMAPSGKSYTVSLPGPVQVKASTLHGIGPSVDKRIHAPAGSVTVQRGDNVVDISYMVGA